MHDDVIQSKLHAEDWDGVIQLLEPHPGQLPPPARAIRWLFKAYCAKPDLHGAENTHRVWVSTNLSSSQLYTLHLGMAEVYLAVAQVDAAVKVIGQARTIQPKHPWAYSLLNKLHHANDTLEQAAGLFEQMLNEDAQNVHALVQRAKVCCELGWWPEAGEAAQGALKLNPRLGGMSQILTDSRSKTAIAPQLFREAVLRRRDQDDSVGMLRYGLAWANQTGQRADFVQLVSWLDEIGRPSAAIEFLEHHVREQPTDALAVRLLRAGEAPPPPRSYKEWEIYRKTGRYAEAIRHFGSLTERDPKNPYPHIYRAYAYEALQQFDQAYKSHCRAAELSGTGDALVEVGKFCLRHRMEMEAIEAFEKALQLDGSLEAERHLSAIPRWRATQQELLRSRTSQPGDAYLHAIWAWWREQAVPTADAVKYFRTLAGTFDNLPTLFGLLGQACAASGDLRGAAAAYWYKAALQGSATDYVRLGDFCFREPELKQLAHKAYQTALALNPFYYYAREQLARLDGRSSEPPQLLAGDEYREDLARRLCDEPQNREIAGRLRDKFIQDRAVEDAANTYSRLREIHPDRVQLEKDLATILDACCHSRPALSKPSIAPEMPWWKRGGVRKIGFEYDERTQLLMKVAEHETTTEQPKPEQLLRQARQQEKGDPLAAAWLYHRVGKPDRAWECLATHGRMRARSYRQMERFERAAEYDVDALWATINSASAQNRSTTLSRFVLDTLQVITDDRDAPGGWPKALVGECRILLNEAGGQAPLRLRHLFLLLEEFLATLLTSDRAMQFASLTMVATAIRRYAASLPLKPDCQQLEALITRWLPAEPEAPVPGVSTAHLELKVTQNDLAAADDGTLALTVHVSNPTDTPADSVRVTLSGPGFVTSQPEVFVPAILGHRSQPLTFELEATSDETKYVEPMIELRYFNPIALQTHSSSGRRFLRPDRPFEAVGVPYEFVWPVGGYVPTYWSSKQVQTEIVARGRQYGLRWIPEAIQRAVEITGGETLTLLILARGAVERLNNNRRVPEISPDDIPGATEEILSRPETCPHFAALLRDAPTRLRPFLSSLAARTATGKEWVAEVDLWHDWQELRQDRPMRRPTSTLFDKQALGTVVEVESQMGGTFRCRFRIPLLASWLRRHYALPQAAADLHQYDRAMKTQLVEDLWPRLEELKLRHLRILAQLSSEPRRVSSQQPDYLAWRDGILDIVRALLVAKDLGAEGDLFSQFKTGLMRVPDLSVNQDAIHRRLSEVCRLWGLDDYQTEVLTDENADALLQVIEFFQSVLGGVIRQDPTIPPPVPTTDLPQEAWRALRRELTSRFNQSELITLCFDMGISSDDLGGDGLGLEGRITKLVEYVQRHDELRTFIRIIRDLRPNISWNGDLAAFNQP